MAALNAVSQWQGELLWVGEASGGTTKNGRQWQRVDFALSYVDSHMNDRAIVFSAFGNDIVDKILSTPLGTPILVTWWPEANQDKQGRYWPKLAVTSVSVQKPGSNSQHSQRKSAEPIYPQQQIRSGSFEDEGADLPF